LLFVLLTGCSFVFLFFFFFCLFVFNNQMEELISYIAVWHLCFDK
jgi:hypothetical protein